MGLVFFWLAHSAYGVGEALSKRELAI